MIFGWWLLGKLGCDGAVSQLIWPLDDDKVATLRAACWALRGFPPDPRAVPALIRLLTHADDGVFCAACRTLAAYGARDAVELLYPVLNSANARRVQAARRTLELLGERRGVEAYLGSLHGDQAAARELNAVVSGGNLWPVDLLVARLALPAEQEHGMAAALLVRIADSAVVSRLVTRTNQDSDLARSELCRVLGRIRDRRAREALRGRLTDSAADVVSAACDALAEIGDPADCEPLVGLISDGRTAVRASALTAAARLAPVRVGALVAERLRSDPDDDLACPICRRAAAAWSGVQTFFCLVDFSDGTSQLPLVARTGQRMLSRWDPDGGLFDFSAVAVRAADQFQINRFLLRVQEAGARDPERKRGYRRMDLSLWPGTELPESLLRNLRDTFRRVILGNEPDAIRIASEIEEMLAKVLSSEEPADQAGPGASR